MLYIHAAAKWVDEKMNSGLGGVYFPENLSQFVQEADEGAFDKYDAYTSRYYPMNDGYFFETPEAYQEFLEENGWKPSPTEENPFRVQFIPVVQEDEKFPYTKEYIVDNLSRFHIDWKDYVYRYSPLVKNKVRRAWKENEACTDIVSNREEFFAIRRILITLMAYLGGNITDEKKAELAAIFKTVPEAVTLLDTDMAENLTAYLAQEKEIREVKDIVNARHEKDYGA